MAQYHLTRRASLLSTILHQSRGGVAIIRTAPEVPRNADADYPYRYDSYFHYLSGFGEPEAVMVLIASPAGNKSILFCREKNLEREIWDGYRYGPAAAQAEFGFDEAHPIDALPAMLPALLANQPAVYAQLGVPAVDAMLQTAFSAIRAQSRAGQTPPAQLRDVTQVLSEQRLIKDTHEQGIMAHAASISAAAHVRAMQTTRVGQREYQVEAELLHEFRRHGSQFPAYQSIVATGANSCVLHYRADAAELKDGDMLLIDAGCELDGYASDITRSFPVNGVFSGPQRAVYELVLAAQDACLAELAPGKLFSAYNDAATRVLAQGVIDLGWIKGSLDGVLESGAYRQFYMHRAGHWLGMDVHDCGDYRDPDSIGQSATTGERPYRALQAGMVLTVEPGLYVRPADNVPPEFWNIGVRIEDDALITPTGYALTTRGVPVAIADIEAIMRDGKSRGH